MVRAILRSEVELYCVSSVRQGLSHRNRLRQSLLPALVALGLLQPATAQDIAAIAASPNELVRYVETHRNFDWAPIWKALGVNRDHFPSPLCEGEPTGVNSCSAELIAVDSPRQIVVLLEHRIWSDQVYLRYKALGTGGWQFTGAYSPPVKYFRPTHRIFRFGLKPFLVVTSQGNSGSGLSSTIENWIDLSTDTFAPVLGFVSDGHHSPLPTGIHRQVHGFVISSSAQPVERITVGMSIEFAAVKSIGADLPLGTRRDELTYVRNGTPDFRLDPEQSSVSADELRVYYYDLEEGFTDESFLKFNFKGLLSVARSGNAEGRKWLSRFLRRCADTPEKRQLTTALASQQ